MFAMMGFWLLVQGKYQCHAIVAASFFFGLATMTRSTGALLSIFVAYPMIRKILLTRNCISIFKYLMCSWFCALFILMPIFVLHSVKPYDLHCDTKIDRTNAVPIWCMDRYPNVYSYVQFVYWDNKFMSVLTRSWDKTLVSVPMLLIFMYMIVREIFK
jgi:Gpi18-like mannosyltransferase